MANQLKGDPTRTTLLRRRFVINMRSRFVKINRAIKQLIVGKDIFGLENKIVVLQESQAWRFQTNPQKVESFRGWLQSEIDMGLLSTEGFSSKPWMATYIDSAYRRGMVRAYTDVHVSDLLLKGKDFYEGGKTQFLSDAFMQGVATKKLELLYTRAFEELRGISAAMSQQISRVLTNGMVQGIGPREIAREMSRVVDGITNKRAVLLARTEIIAAHAEGQLDGFQLLGIEEVEGEAEWSTAGDERVCSECAGMEGAVFSISDARGMIPLHAACRCAWIPVISRSPNKRQ